MLNPRSKNFLNEYRISIFLYRIIYFCNSTHLNALNYLAMKKLILLKALLFYALFISGQTATNFICKDCNGVEHELFAELDAGKVIVIDWVMPCGPCAGPTLTAYNIVQSYQSTHPGKVHMYVCDDFADTPCIALASWLSGIGVTNVTLFSNPAINMMDYGSYGMPKIVIVAGPARQVFYNANFSINPQQFIQALEQAIIASSVSTGDLSFVDESYLRILPNPSDGNFSLVFNSENEQKIVIEIFNSEMKPVSTGVTKIVPPGLHHIPFSYNGPSGVYFIRIFNGTDSIFRKHLIIH